MIIYLNSNQPQHTYDDKLSKIKFTTELFEFDKLITVTEKNHMVLRDILRLYSNQHTQFITYSFKEFDKLSPTQISELIIYMVDKLKMKFYSYEDDIYFNKDNLLSIYPKIFEYYRNQKL